MAGWRFWFQPRRKSAAQGSGEAFEAVRQAKLAMIRALLADIAASPETGAPTTQITPRLPAREARKDRILGAAA